MPTLAQAIAARLDPEPDDALLAATYDHTLNILFRQRLWGQCCGERAESGGTHTGPI